MTAAISSSSPSPLPQVSAPSPAPQRQNGFAQLLSQRQAAAAQEAQADAAPKAAPNAAPNAAPKSASADAASDVKRAAQSTANAAARAAKPVQRERAVAKAEKSDKPKATDAASAAEADKAETADTAKTADDTKTMDPALADWLAGLHRPTDAPETAIGLPGGHGTAAAGHAKAGVDGLTDAADGTDGGGRGAGRMSGHSARPGKGSDAVAEPADRLRAAQDARQADAATSTTAADWQAAVEHASAPVAASDKTDNAVGALNLAAAVAAPARHAEAAVAASVAVATPVNSPEFPQALGVQISVLARDGVQQAELHLNPADMGPISVQIALDGSQAQVNFGADSAATRQIIESGLPELAAALRDAGFTLSGGGVHQQASGQRGDESGSGNNGQGRSASVGGVTGTAGPEAVAPLHIRTRIAAGGVDTYA